MFRRGSRRRRAEREAARAVPETGPAAPSGRGRRISVRWRAVLGIGLLLAAVAFFALGLQRLVPVDLVARWPWALVVGGAGLLLAGMVTAWAAGTLAGPPLAALGAAALAGQQGTPLSLTLVGGALLAGLGIGIVVRGLTAARR